MKIKAEVLSNMRRLSLAPHALIARALWAYRLRPLSDKQASLPLIARQPLGYRMRKTTFYYQRNIVLLPEKRSFSSRETMSCIKRLFRPDGLPVRSLRTANPKPTDWARDLDEAIANIRWIGREKSRNSKMSLTYSHDPSQRPMYKGLRAREGYSFSLTSPSLFYLRALTSMWWEWMWPKMWG